MLFRSQEVVQFFSIKIASTFNGPASTKPASGDITGKQTNGSAPSLAQSSGSSSSSSSSSGNKEYSRQWFLKAPRGLLILRLDPVTLPHAPAAAEGPMPPFGFHTPACFKHSGRSMQSRPLFPARLHGCIQGLEPPVLGASKPTVQTIVPPRESK